MYIFARGTISLEGFLFRSLSDKETKILKSTGRCQNRLESNAEVTSVVFPRKSCTYKSKKDRRLPHPDLLLAFSIENQLRWPDQWFRR